MPDKPRSIFTAAPLLFPRNNRGAFIHLSDTGGGLALIATGYPPADIPHINNICELGLDQ